MPPPNQLNVMIRRLQIQTTKSQFHEIETESCVSSFSSSQSKCESENGMFSAK